MVSQAVFFNMFLSLFAILLAVLGMIRLYLEGKPGQELVRGYPEVEYSLGIYLAIQLSRVAIPRDT
jgi:hypothetical protein